MSSVISNSFIPITIFFFWIINDIECSVEYSANIFVTSFKNSCEASNLFLFISFIDLFFFFDAYQA